MVELTVLEMANRVCEHLPEGYELRLVMERGSAWVELDKGGKRYELPDAADVTLEKQINDALCIARGWGTWVSSQQVLGAKA